MTSPQTAGDVLDRTYLQIRARILEVGAALDRLERSEEWKQTEEDPRLQLVRRAIDVLNESGFDRAERIQQIFSDEYDPEWRA